MLGDKTVEHVVRVSEMAVVYTWKEELTLESE
jgi:hypothetical protein